MFKLIAIEVLKPLEEEVVERRRYKSVHKILSFTKEDMAKDTMSRIYYLHKGYKCEGGQTHIDDQNLITDNAFYTAEGTRICFSAVVGENGMGKSSILELFFRLVNNAAYACKVGIDKGVSYNLLFVPDVYATAYFEDTDGSFFSIAQFDNKITCKFQSDQKEDWEYLWSSNQTIDSHFKKAEAIQHLSNLFYTVVVNYASYAYNTTDYMQEWDENRFAEETRTEEERCWLSALFHKNDSYQTPIVLNPFRESGNVNYNNERNLTQERLFRLVLDDRSPLKRVLRKKDAKALIFDLNSEYLPNKRRGNHYDSDRVLWEMRQLRMINNGRIYSGTKVTEVARCILDSWSRCVGFSLYAKDNKEYVANATKDVIAALNYIVYKTLKIINTYPSFAAFKYTIANYTDEQKQEQNDSLRDAIQSMYENDSHITLKLRRCLAFLLFRHYTSIQTLKADDKLHGKIIEITELKNQIDHCIEHTDEFVVNAQNVLGKVTLYKYAKEKPMVWSLNTLMPASFMHTDLLLQNDEGGEVSFNSLSSGEKQMIHAMSAILYQIGNIESSWGNKAKQAHYSKICLVFDEIELYFHPKYQTMLVAFMIETLQGLNLEKVKDIQIILSTHSPFILSDIPTNDILMIKDGEQTQPEEESETFCANVYDILNSQFFMKRFVGDLASIKLDNLIRDINAYRVNPSDEKKVALKKRIKIIGDDFISLKLTNALEI